MPGNLDFDITLDPSQYLAGAQQITQANIGMQSAMANVITQSTIVQRGLDAVTPKRATLLAWGALAAGAGQTEQAMSGFEATQATTGVSADKLGAKVRQLARDLPIGGTAARQVVAQFTQMGIAGEGSEVKIGKLSTAVAKLSGATGSDLGSLASGMTDFARATGNTNLDPARFEKLGDSLTTISAKTGAGATNILAFSKNIAPMASAAGIGATGVLGISSAFARLGEDGVGASTAVNKMLSDLNRSVREGTPEIKTYASFVGKTADEFTALFKSNPAEALTQITESIAKSGTQGPRMLEQIGLDGVRSQRALQALSASGGLRGAIGEATASYGNGATDKASQAAFGGLNDASSMLQENFKQLGDAIGQPLLGPLTSFVKALSVPVSGLRNVVESPIAQKGLEVAAGAAIAIGLAKAIAGPLSVLGIGKQALTSSPMRALFAGYSNAGGDRTGRALAYGAPVQRLVNSEGIYGRGMAAVPAERSYGLGAGLRQAREAQLLQRMGPAAYYDRMLAQQTPAGPAGPGGPGLLRRGLGGLGRYGSAAAEAYGNSLRQSFRDPNVPIGQRGMVLTPPRVMNAYDTARTARDGGAGMRDTVRAFNTSLKDSGSAVKGWTGALGAHGKALGSATALLGGFSRQGAGLVGSAAMRGAGAIGGGLMSFAGGPVGLALAGGMGAYQIRQGINQRNDAARDSFIDSDISGTLNAYRDSIGKATGPVKTVGSLDMSVSQNLAAGVSTFDQARAVTSADQQAAESSKSKIVNPYVGDNKDISAQVSAINTGGLTPEELQAVKIDLLRQGKTTSDIGEIFKGLPEGAFASGNTTNPNMGIVDNGALISGLGKQPGQGGIVGLANFLDTTGSPVGAWQGPRDPFYASNLGDSTRKQLGGVSQSINQQYDAQSGSYGADYATQTRMQGVDKAYADAMKTGNVDLVNELSKQFSVVLGGKDAQTYIDPDQLARAGGSFTKALAGTNDAFAHTLDDFGKKQEAAGGSFQATLKPGYITDLLKESSPFLSNIFDQQNMSATGQSVQNSLAKPGDVGKLTEASQAIVNAATSSGKSLSDLAGEAANAAGKLDETGQQFAVLAQTQGQIQLQLRKNSLTQTTGQAAQAQYDVTSAIANQAPSNSTAVNQQRQQAQQDQVTQQASMIDRIKQRLMVQRQSDIASARATEDNNRQVSQANADFQKQQSRTIESFQIQRTRSLEDYHQQIARAEDDFAVSRGRQMRDYETGQQRGEADFLKGRIRAIRDFNIQMARMVQDAAKSLYDPYSRIQTKATWDAKNLLVNLAEQNSALAKQKTQLDQLRKQGLSAQVIDQLQLGKTENAQQVNTLSMDLTKDPSLVKQLNATSAARQGLSGAMVNDASNTDLNRTKDDFAKSLKDQETDYKTSVERSRADLSKAMRDQATDFTKNLTRGGADFAKSLKRSEADLALSQAHMETDFATSMSRQQETFNIQMGRMHTDLMNADQQLGGDMTKLATAYDKAIHGQTVKWGDLITSDANQFISDFRTKVLPDIGKLATEIGIVLPNTMPAGAAQTTQGYASKQAGARGMASGGKVAGQSAHDRADDIDIRATAGEWVHPVKTARHYGDRAMEAIRTRKVPRELLDGYADGGRVWPTNTRQLSPSYPGHSGVDIAAHMGAPIFAPEAGTITYAGYGHGYGQGIFERFASGLEAVFGHSSKVLIPSGAVTAGQTIGLVGSTGHATGPHLHFEVNSPGAFGTSANRATSMAYLNGATVSGIGAGVSGLNNGGGTSANTGSVNLASAMAKMDQTRGGWYGLLRDSFTAQMKAKDAANATSGATGASAYNGGGAAQWTTLVNAVLGMLNQPLSEAGAILRRIDFESGGNPRAVNRTDSNARAGHPSQGLMQTIQSTFDAYGSAKLSSDIFDPEANIYAGANYALKRYGSLNAIDPLVRPKGYDSGGIMDPGTGTHFNGTGKPEAVLTDHQWDSIHTLASYAGQALTREDGRVLTGASGAHMSVHNGDVTYDNRVDFTGSRVTVVSGDPDEMGRKLAAKARMQKLTDTRSVRRTA